jgi:hypothetical protein
MGWSYVFEHVSHADENFWSVEMSESGVDLSNLMRSGVSFFIGQPLIPSICSRPA